MTIDEMRARKNALGYTNEMIAQRSGVPLSTVQKVFAGITSRPRYETLRALERVLRAEAAETACSPDMLPGEQPSNGGRTGVLREEETLYLTKEHSPEESSPADRNALPDNIRAEWIDGQPCLMETPDCVHQLLVTELWGHLRSYIQSQSSSYLPFAAPLEIRLDDDGRTMLRPDVVVVCDRSRVSRQRISGAPDLVIEIQSTATRRRDLYLKPGIYREAGVREYWIVDPDRRQVLIYDFEQDDRVSLYGFEDDIPVGIFEGDCVIPFREISDYVSFLCE